jgi:hypothetical protein
VTGHVLVLLLLLLPVPLLLLNVIETTALAGSWCHSCH